tara:strand:- start:8207 stop:9361 length:1155 start_codon:yes stop_codon:yes gene_type:complete
MLLIIKESNENSYETLALLVGMGAFLPQLLNSDYYKEFNLAVSNDIQSGKNPRNNIKINNILWPNYVKNSTLNIFFIMPVVILLVRPASLLLSILTITFTLGEKLFDELQRFLQCAEADIRKFSLFLFFRRICMLLPFLLIIKKIDSNIVILLLSCMSILSNVISWYLVRSNINFNNDIKGFFINLKINFRLIKSFFLSGYPIKQLLLSIILSSYNLLPYTFVRNLELTNNSLSSFALYQRIYLIPILIYTITFYTNNRWRLISQKIIDDKLRSKVFIDILVLTIIIIFISIILYYTSNNLMFLPLLISHSLASIILLIPLDNLNWNKSINKKIITFFPVLICTFLLTFINFSFSSQFIIYLFLLCSLIFPSLNNFFIRPNLLK